MDGNFIAINLVDVLDSVDLLLRACGAVGVLGCAKKKNKFKKKKKKKKAKKKKKHKQKFIIIKK
jgi:hypothetical protein